MFSLRSNDPSEDCGIQALTSLALSITHRFYGKERLISIFCKEVVPATKHVCEITKRQRL